MLRKEAVITVYGLQEDEQGAGEPITVVTPGHFYRQNGAYIVIYEESELTGLVDTRTMIKASPDAVSVSRVGKYPSQLSFEKGKRQRAQTRIFDFVDNTTYRRGLQRIYSRRICGRRSYKL